MLITMMALFTLVSCDDIAVTPAQVPAEIQSFVQQNFPNQSITFAKKDIVFFGSKYDIVLADGTQIDFDRDNVWDKISCPMTPVPATLVPQPVTNYVNTNFPAAAILKVDKERYGYEVELANGLELKFNKQGMLMEMDD